jgi:transcriptional regulator with XRE-family HTH domain
MTTVQERRAAVLAARSDINLHIGSRIKQLRRKYGMTQAEFGAVFGLSNQQIQRYEKGYYTISMDLTWLIAQYFNVSLDYVAEGLGAAVVADLLGNPQEAGKPPVATYPRLFLSLTQALQQCPSKELAQSMLELLRATAPNPSITDEEDGDE